MDINRLKKIIIIVKKIKFMWYIEGEEGSMLLKPKAKG